MHHVLAQMATALQVGLAPEQISEYGPFAGHWVPAETAIPAGDWVADAAESYCPLTWSEPNMPATVLAALGRDNPCMVVDGKLFVACDDNWRASFFRFSPRT